MRMGDILIDTERIQRGCEVYTLPPKNKFNADGAPVYNSPSKNEFNADVIYSPTLNEFGE